MTGALTRFADSHPEDSPRDLPFTTTITIIDEEKVAIFQTERNLLRNRWRGARLW